MNETFLLIFGVSVLDFRLVNDLKYHTIIKPPLQQYHTTQTAASVTIPSSWTWQSRWWLDQKIILFYFTLFLVFEHKNWFKIIDVTVNMKHNWIIVITKTALDHDFDYFFSQVDGLFIYLPIGNSHCENRQHAGVKIIIIRQEQTLYVHINYECFSKTNVPNSTKWERASRRKISKISLFRMRIIVIFCGKDKTEAKFIIALKHDFTLFFSCTKRKTTKKWKANFKYFDNFLTFHTKSSLNYGKISSNFFFFSVCKTQKTVWFIHLAQLNGAAPLTIMWCWWLGGNRWQSNV